MGDAIRTGVITMHCKNGPPYLTRIISVLTALFVASFPLDVYAAVHETLKLLPDDGASGDEFGFAVAVGDGLAVVGAPQSGMTGAVYVFDSVTGQQMHKLVPADLSADASFGRSIAVDGNLAVIGGAPGAAYVYDLTTGSQINKLVADDNVLNDLFGHSVAIHGSTVMIGAPFADATFNDAGAVYLFDAVSGNQMMKFTADVPHEDDRLGDAVAFNGGLVAAYDRGAQSSVLLFDPQTGNQLADIHAPDSSLTGSSVAIAGDRLLVGAPSVFNAAISGIYDISDPNNITTQLIPRPGDPLQGHFFGDSVALSDNAALVSTWFRLDLGASGIVYMFDPSTGAVLESFRPSEIPTEDRFGDAIGLHGQTLVVGAPGQDQTDSGAAYLFTIPEPASLAALLALGPVLLRRKDARRSAIVR